MRRAQYQKKYFAFSAYYSADTRIVNCQDFLSFLEVTNQMPTLEQLRVHFSRLMYEAKDRAKEGRKKEDTFSEQPR